MRKDWLRQILLKDRLNAPFYHILISSVWKDNSIGVYEFVALAGMTPLLRMI